MSLALSLQITHADIFRGPKSLKVRDVSLTYLVNSVLSQDINLFCDFRVVVLDLPLSLTAYLLRCGCSLTLRGKCFEMDLVNHPH